MTAVAAKSPAKPRSLLEWANALTTPFLPDDYLELVNPLWSTRTVHAKVIAVAHETADAVSLTLKMGRGWSGHIAGQFLRVAVPVDGVRHWRCYSISSAPSARSSVLTITVKAIAGGRVSTELVRNATVGMTLEVANADGHFTWLDGGLQRPEKALMIAAGSGITPVMALLREADGANAMPDTTVLFYSPTAEDAIFRAELAALAERHPALTVHFIQTRGTSALRGHFGVNHLAKACPDWKSRMVWACGPQALLDAVEAQWAAQGLIERLTVERFQPTARVANAGAIGGSVCFSASQRQVQADGGTSLLETAEANGLAPASGCRMGICHGCTATLKSGQVRDLRDGRVFGEEGDLIQICVCAPAGDVQIAL